MTLPNADFRAPVWAAIARAMGGQVRVRLWAVSADGGLSGSVETTFCRHRVWNWASSEALWEEIFWFRGPTTPDRTKLPSTGSRNARTRSSPRFPASVVSGQIRRFGEEFARSPGVRSYQPEMGALFPARGRPSGWHAIQRAAPRRPAWITSPAAGAVGAR